jgi:hypothetical protein
MIFYKMFSLKRSNAVHPQGEGPAFSVFSGRGMRPAAVSMIPLLQPDINRKERKEHEQPGKN